MASPARRESACTTLLGPLLDGQTDTVRDALAAALREGPSRSAVFEDVLLPCLREIGDLWERGELSVPDEHLASETVMQVLHDLRPEATDAADAPMAVVGCAHLDNHLLPALLAADLLVDAGWRVCFLGGSVPPADLVAFVRRRKPQLLVLTSTMARTAAGVTAVSRTLRGADRPAILVGGAGVRDVAAPSLLGADALGRRLGDLVAFADRVAAGEADLSGDDRASRRPPEPRTKLSAERVVVVLEEAGTALSMNELQERCGASVAQIGTALSQLERGQKVRFVRGRWALVGPRGALGS